MSIELLPKAIRENYECLEWKNATAILKSEHPKELEDICQILGSFKLLRSHIQVGGGRKSLVSETIDAAFTARGWSETRFETKISLAEYKFPPPDPKKPKKKKKSDDDEGKGVLVGTHTYDSPTHKVDCYKNGVGLEIEWNNKDPFYDRDLNNFRLLFELRALTVGVILTRRDELQAIFNQLGRKDSFGNSTTHMSKLLPRLDGGAGGGCPILVLGISKKLYVDDLGTPYPKIKPKKKKQSED